LRTPTCKLHRIERTHASAALLTGVSAAYFVAFIR
jgi:hypothetical protein